MSTSVSRAGKSKPKTLLALLTTFLVALSGLFVVPAATAAEGPTVNAVASTNADAGTLSVDVTAAGLPGDISQAYAALIVKGSEGSVGMGGGYAAFVGAPFVAVTAGNAAFTLTAQAADLDPAKAYEVIIWKVHSGLEGNLYARADVTITDAQWNDLFPPAPAVETTLTLATNLAEVDEGGNVTLSATVSPAEATGTVKFYNGGVQIGDAQAVSAGKAGISTGALAAGTHSFTAEFAPQDASAFVASASNKVSVNAVKKTDDSSEDDGSEDDGSEDEGVEETPVATPSVEVVGNITNLDPTAETVVTVKGSGFLPNNPDTTGTRPPLAGKFTGAYVVFGSFADDWKPSEGAAPSTRSVINQMWAVPAESLGMMGAAGTELKADGTFETQLTLKADEAKALADGTYGIVTYPGGGAKYAPFETFTEVTFAPLPKVEVVGQTTGLNPNAETTVTVKGSGFLPNAPATSGSRPPLAGKFTGAYVVFGSFADDWRPSEGAASSTRSVIDQMWTVPAESLGMMGDAGTELKEDGTFETQLTLKADEAKAIADGTYGIVTYSGSGASYRAFETFTEVTFAEPTVEVVGDITDLDPEAETTVTVKGSGFFPNDPETTGSRPPLAGKFTGAYVVFGSFADTWRPSEGAAPSTRSVIDQMWAVPAESLGMMGAAGTELKADGTFETELTITADEAKALERGTYGIVTYAGSGATYAPFETFTKVTFQGEEDWTPAIEVFMADGVTPYTDQELRDGDELVVKGTGFDPEANIGSNPNSPIPAGQPQGTFAVFGSFTDTWRPSEGHAASHRVMNKDSREWAVSDAVFDAMPEPESIADSRVVLSEDGSFTATVTLYTPTVSLPENGNWGIYTYAGGVGTANAAQELGVNVNFVPKATDEEEPSAATGGLIWSFKSSWNWYLDNIAGGVREVSNGATLGSNDQVGFVQVPGGDYDPETGLGTIKYQGTVNYTSTKHGFDAVLQNPWIVFTADGAVLTAEVSKDAEIGKTELVRLTMAALNAEAPTTDDDGTLRWDAVTGIFSETLTNPESWADYIGEDIDPVTFTFGEEATDPVSAPSVRLDTPKVAQGGKITFTGTGFTPGAEVQATVYSTPTAAGSATVNSDGVATITWTVPANFAVGTHTVELVAGEETAETTFEVTAASTGVTPTPTAPAEEDQCVARAVTGGSFNWGVKQSFREYLERPFVSGGFSGGGFSVTSGAVNTENNGIGMINFSGAFSATGHGGTLDWSLRNPSIQITSPTSGLLYATAGGSRVTFATLTFSGVSISGDTLSVSGASARITAAGAATLSYDGEPMYETGTALDSVSFSVSLGGEVECDTSTDPVLLAATGTPEQGTAAMMSIALVLMLVGAGLVSARRRGAYAQR